MRVSGRLILSGKEARMGISNAIRLLIGVSMFLFGMTLMGDGLKRVAGNRLEPILYRLSGTPLKGVLFGTAITAIIQSSSATSVMVVGFVNSGLMKLKQAFGIILGAILGTSITGWIICLSSLNGKEGLASLFSTTTITGLVAVIGIYFRMFSSKTTHRHLGDVLMGFAVLMVGLSLMSDAVTPLRESEAFLRLMTSFSNPLLGILVGLAFTCLIQSASAAVGILQALALTGLVPFSVAFPVIMGIAVGAALPVLLSALGAMTNGKRTAFVYLLINLTGTVVIGGIFYAIHAVHPFGFMDRTMSMVDIAALNTVFRFLTVILLAPFLGLLEKLTRRIIRGGNRASLVDDMDLLEDRFIEHPALAIEQSRSVINSMASRAQENITAAFSLLTRYSETGFNEVRDLEELVDRYEDRIGTYLVKINSNELTEQQNEDLSKFLHTISDFERISDHAQNIAECAKEIYEHNICFSGEAKRELSVMQDAVADILALSIRAFAENDIQLATRVEPLEDVIDTLCDELKLHHIDRLQKGICTLNQGFVFNDLITNYERVADHCSNIAVAMIELESDAFDTHEYINSLMKMKDESFARYSEEYKKKYAI